MKFAIIAAGEGSRLAEEGIKQPKPLVPLCGEPMIDRLIGIFKRQGATEIVVIVNRLTNETERHLRLLQEAEGDCYIRIVVKTTPSSMHSFYELSPYLRGERFCLTTVDTIFREADFKAFCRYCEASIADGIMAVTDYIDDERPLYVATDKDLQITGFHDTCEGDRFISGGIYCLNDNALNTLQRCIEGGQSRMRNFQRQLVADGWHLVAYPFSKILDVDHAEDIKKAEQFIGERIIAVRRAPLFSPNSVDKDEAILQQVVCRLEKDGYNVQVYDEDKFAQERPMALAAFSMARGEAALDWLDELEKRGAAVINTASGVRNCERWSMTELMLLNDIPTADSWLVDDDASFGEAMKEMVYPCWIKRGDACAQVRDDVCYIGNEGQLRKAWLDFRARGISRAVITKHLGGDLVKFYSVEGNTFFHWFYPTCGELHSKFGLETYNGKATGYPFSVEALKACADRMASLLGVPVYGGDCIVDADGSFRIIDFNDWPSYARCLNDAAEAIATCMIKRIKNNR